MKRLGTTVMTTMAVAILALAGGAASAAPASVNTSVDRTSNAGSTLGFGFTSDSTAEDILASIEAANSPEEIAAYTESLEAVANPTVEQADLLGVLTEEPGISARSLSSAPVLGEPINDAFNWRNKFDMGWTECPFLRPCYVKWKITTTITTQPGEFGSKSSLKFLTTGTGAPSVSITSTVYGNGSNVSEVSKVWSPTSAATQYNSPHQGLLGKTFQARYVVSTLTPGGTLTVEYKTKLSNTCKKPSGKPFRCIFTP